MSFDTKIKFTYENMSLVSIILPTYNWTTKWLTESINSVLSQSYNNFELIIINDSSTNDIEDTILEFVKKDNRIKYFKNETNLERSRSRNKWIGLAKWKYIAFIDDDDIWLEEKLQTQVDFMEKNIEYWLCWTDIICIDELWIILNNIITRKKNKDLKNNLLIFNQFALSSVLIKKEILTKSWLFNKDLFLWEDYDLWLRIWIYSKLQNLDFFWIKYRDRVNNTSNNNILKSKIETLKICIKYKKYYSYFIKALILRIWYILLPEVVSKNILKLIKK